MTLDALNALPADAAAAAFRSCCGAENWVQQMVAARPFTSVEALLSAAESIWWSLGEADWREAFAHHPRIGSKKSATPQDDRARNWSSGEQSGMNAAAVETRAALAEVNEAYEARFGYIYIVCATGRSAEEMLALARQRLQNDPAAEIRVAAEEQNRITRLRLEKLLAETSS